MSKTYLVIINSSSPLFITAESEADAFSKLAVYWHGWNKVFDLAMKNMENLNQLIELYQTFYEDKINVFLEIDVFKGFIMPHMDWIGGGNDA